MVICLELSADLHMAQLMPLPLTISCFNKIQIGFTFLAPAHPGSPGKKAVKWVCDCVYLCQLVFTAILLPRYHLNTFCRQVGDYADNFLN